MEGSANSLPCATKDAATHNKDPLTGLFQQDYLFNRLTTVLTRQRTAPVTASLALLQLENFYEIRHWVGKSEANLLLSDIARLLKQTLPDPILLCRCAHYEFAALLVDDSSIHAQALIQRVKQALQCAVSASIPPQLELQCAVGLAVMDEAVPSSDVMFARARHNLGVALARQRQGNTLDPEPGAAVALSPQQVRSTLSACAMALSFQAVINLNLDSGHLFEVRCVPRDAAISASALFSSAVHNALGERLDRWVIQHCLSLLRKTHPDSRRLIVNLTQNTLVSTRFFPWLQGQLDGNASLASKLVFQISELDVLTTQHHMNHVSHQLAELQVALAISHFGCTSDPFRYLPLLRAQYIKLDDSLTARARVDQDQQKQLAAMVARTQGSGLRVIAAGIEDMHLLPLLFEAGIRLVQGYCLHAPHRTMNYCFPQHIALQSAPDQGTQRTN